MENKITEITNIQEIANILAHNTAINYNNRNNRNKTGRKGRKPKYQVHPNYFDKIDDECKAYFLGLLLTDGCNYKGRISIALQDGDQHILEQISKTIFVEPKPLKLKKIPQYKQFKEGGKYYKCKNQWQLSISNKKIAEHMKSFGLIPRKSLVLEYPPNNTITEELFPHFLRGVFDGDGCISGAFYKNSEKYHVAVSICSASQSFLLSLQSKMLKYLNLPSEVYMSKKPEPTKGKNGYAAMYLLTVRKAEDLETLYRSLYKNASYYLNRKKKRFTDFIHSKFFYRMPIFY